MKKKNNNLIIIIAILIVIILSLLNLYRCPLYFLFGIPCPTCGMTRALLSLLSLNFKMSFYYNALWPLIFIALIIYILCELKIIKISYKNKLILAYILVAIFVIYNLLRICFGNFSIGINFHDSIIYKLFFK